MPKERVSPFIQTGRMSGSAHICGQILDKEFSEEIDILVKTAV